MTAAPNPMHQLADDVLGVIDCLQGALPIGPDPEQLAYSTGAKAVCAAVTGVIAKHLLPDEHPENGATA